MGRSGRHSLLVFRQQRRRWKADNSGPIVNPSTTTSTIVAADKTEKRQVMDHSHCKPFGATAPAGMLGLGEEVGPAEHTRILSGDLTFPLYDAPLFEQKSWLDLRLYQEVLMTKVFHHEQPAYSMLSRYSLHSLQLDHCLSRRMLAAEAIFFIRRCDIPMFQPGSIWKCLQPSWFLQRKCS
jgi:hypothetical protein